MSSSESGALVFGSLIGGVLAAVITSLFWHDHVEHLRLQASEAGAAEFRIDPVTGETSFHWLGSQGERHEDGRTDTTND